MGSTFGKVRKYNLHSSDSSSFKYNSGSEEEVKPLSTDNKEIFSHPPEQTLSGEVNKANSKLKTSHQTVNIFGAGYSDQLFPDYYNIHANEGGLISQNNLKHSSNMQKEEGDYITLKEAMARPPIPPPLPKNQTDPPPLPPRNKPPPIKPESPSVKPNRAFNSNPRPNQKVYSAEDINRLLRPMNSQNLANMRSINQPYDKYHERVYPERHSYILRQPSGYYPCHHICDCQRYSLERSYQNKYSPPPPYNYSVLNQDTGQIWHQRVQSPSPKYHYEETHPPPYPGNSQEHITSTPVHPNYNTISLDKDINNHNWQGYKSPNFNGATQSPKHFHLQNHQRVELVQDTQHSPNDIDLYLTKKKSSRNEDKLQPLRHKRDPLHQTETFNQPELRSEPYGYRSLRARPCYTIPEEGSWIPPFHYHTTMQPFHHRACHN